jgi:hypothetical protein
MTAYDLNTAFTGSANRNKEHPGKRSAETRVYEYHHKYSM